MQNGVTVPSSVAQRDRERQRERERSQRAAVAAAATISMPGMAGVESTAPGNLPEFDRPIYFGDPTTGEDVDDETSKKIKAELGEFALFAKTVIQNVSQSNHPQLPEDDTRKQQYKQQCKKKAQQIFEEMEVKIKPLTGLEDLDNFGTGSGGRSHLPSSLPPPTVQPPPTQPPATCYTANAAAAVVASSVNSRRFPPTNSHAPPPTSNQSSYPSSSSSSSSSSILTTNDTQPSLHNRKGTTQSTKFVATPPRSQPYQSGNAASSAAATAIANNSLIHPPHPPSSLTNHNSNSNSLTYNLSSLSDSDEGLGSSVIHSALTNSAVKVNDILAESITRKRKLTPLTQTQTTPPTATTLSTSNTATTVLSNSNPANKLLKVNHNSSVAAAKLSQPPTSVSPSLVNNPSAKVAPSQSSSSDDDSDASSSDDSDDDDSEGKSSEESSDSSDSSDSDTSTQRKKRQMKQTNKKLSKKQSSVDSVDSKGDACSLPVPSSAGLGPPTNALTNDDWNLDNFIPSENKPKTTTPPLPVISKQSSSSKKNAANLNAAGSSVSSASNKGQTSRYRQKETDTTASLSKAGGRLGGGVSKKKKKPLSSRLSDMEEGEVDSEPDAAKKSDTKQSTVASSNNNRLSISSSSEDSDADLAFDNPEPYDPSQAKLEMQNSRKSASKSAKSVQSNSGKSKKYLPSSATNNTTTNARSTTGGVAHSKVDTGNGPVSLANGVLSSTSAATSHLQTPALLLGNVKERSQTPTNLPPTTVSKATSKVSSKLSDKASKSKKLISELHSDSSSSSSSMSMSPTRSPRTSPLSSSKTTVPNKNKQSKVAATTSSSRASKSSNNNSLLTVPPTSARRSKEHTLLKSQENIQPKSTSAKTSNKRSTASLHNELLNDKEVVKRKKTGNSKTDHHPKSIKAESEERFTPSELNCNIELHKLLRVPLLNGNALHTNDHGSTKSSGKNSREEQPPLRESNKRSNKESISKSVKTEPEDSKNHSKESFMCSIPLTNKKDAKKSSSNKRQGEDEMSDTKDSNHHHHQQQLQSRSTSGTPPGASTANCLLAKSSPLLARHSPATTTTASAHNSSSSNSTTAASRSAEPFPVTNLYQHLHEHEALNKAKVLKRNADRELDRHQQMSMYIEAVLYFVQTGMGMEAKRLEPELEKAFQMYRETLNLLRQTTSKFTKFTPVSRPGGTPDNAAAEIKLTVLCYRCQALITLKLSRMRQKEMNDNKETLAAFTAKDPTVLALTTSHSHSQPPNTSPVQLPTNILQLFLKQLQLLQQTNSVVDLWFKSDSMTERNPQVKDWFAGLNAELGALQLISTFEHLINYVLNGLRNLNL